MEALRTWTFEGEKPLTVTVYKPAMTIRCADGQEAEISPSQLSELCSRLVDAEYYFESEDPEVL